MAGPAVDLESLRSEDEDENENEDDGNRERQGWFFGREGKECDNSLTKFARGADTSGQGVA